MQPPSPRPLEYRVLIALLLAPMTQRQLGQCLDSPMTKVDRVVRRMKGYRSIHVCGNSKGKHRRQLHALTHLGELWAKDLITS